MKSVPGYTKVLTLGSAYTENALIGEVVAQEKVDGSQFSFGINEDGDFVMRSKGQELYRDNAPPMFEKAVNYVLSLKLDAQPDTYFYCEYLQRPKHNTLKYSREPRNNLILFDVLSGGRLVDRPALLEWAETLHVDVIPELFRGIVDVEKIKSFLTTESFLGGEPVEGVVIKNYVQTIFLGGKVTPLFTKYVREIFKERNADEWKTKKPRGGITEFIASFRSPARWEKAVIHAKEQGVLSVSPKDIGMLMKMVAEDVREEETENIKNHLYKNFIDEILRVSVRGLAEWYKNKLFRKYKIILGFVKDMKKIRELVKKHAELVVFFFFLTTSLFLGDGKQPFVDAWWALGILMMYGVRYYQRGKLDLRPLPRAVGWAWAAILLYYVILTPFSDSAGYSITATIRLIEAYLAYLLFYTMSSERVIPLFTKGLLFVGVIATLASFVFLLFPPLAGFLPPMNLLYATYGHNHLADLLLMIFPIVITQSSWLLLIFFTTAMFFTFARGAWLLLIFYLLFLVRKSKNRTIRRVGLVVAAATVGAFLFISLSPFRGIPQKPSLLEDGRWEYWRQATEAIKERPFFGSGPGTFYLQSKRLQSAPSSYSWFAHSFPLETTVEVGIVGTILLSLVLIASLRRARASPLFAPLLLTLLYSFFEFNLNYASMWLLFWAMLGLSSNDKKNNHQKNWGSRGLAVGGLVLLCVFYVSNISSVALDVVGKKKPAFYVTPYIVSTVKNYLEQVSRDNGKLSSIEERLILGFYKKDSDVLFKLEQARASLGSSGCDQLILLDKHNMDFQRECLALLFTKDDKMNAGRALYLLGTQIIPKSAQWRLSLEDFTNQFVLTSLDSILLNGSLSSVDQARYWYAKLVYVVGLQVVTKDPLLTKRLWVLARDILPDWSYFHVELASLDAWVFKDVSSARRRLVRCAELKDPRVHCLYVLTHTIPSVGSQKDFIAAIPKNL